MTVYLAVLSLEEVRRAPWGWLQECTDFSSIEWPCSTHRSLYCPLPPFSAIFNTNLQHSATGN